MIFLLLEMSLKASSLLGLVPAIICNKDISINGAVDIYKDDLPSPELIDMELARWKSKFHGKQVNTIPDSCAKAIKVCDKVMYPNISVLLHIACTLPVTSCECELALCVD